MCFSGTAFGPSLSALAGSGWVSMNTPGDADGDRRARQHRHELALAAAAGALAAGQLHAVRGVEDHRRAGLAHDRQAAHVGHQVVVAEARAALAGHEAVFGQALLARRGARLVDHVLHVVRREELALLDVHRLAALRHGADEVGLAAQEGRRLQHVDDRGHRGDLGLAVHVGQHRHLQLALDLGQDLQALAPCPGRGTRCRWCGWPCRSCVLKMKGMPSAAVISFSRPATSICSCSLSTTQGPAIRKNGLSMPTSKPHSFMPTAFDAAVGARCAWCSQRRLDVADEQRVPAPRRALELGVELHADEPRVHALRQLDDLGQLLALRDRRDHAGRPAAGGRGSARWLRSGGGGAR